MITLIETTTAKVAARDLVRVPVALRLTGETSVRVNDSDDGTVSVYQPRIIEGVIVAVSDNSSEDEFIHAQVYAFTEDEDEWCSYDDFASKPVEITIPTSHIVSCQMVQRWWWVTHLRLHHQ